MAGFKTVLLIGAGGNLGTAVLQAFLASPYSVTVLSRKESKSTFPENVRVVKADYDDSASLESAMRGQDVVISMVGGAVTGDQNRFIDAAVAAGVKRFMPSEFGPDTLNPGTHKIIPSLPSKLHTVEYLKTKERVMEWSSLITGAWLDWGIRTGIFAFDLKTKTVTLVDGGVTIFTATTLPKVGRTIIAMLEHADETRNQYVYVASFNITQKQLLGVFEKIDGEKWTVLHETAENTIRMGNEKLKQGNYDGTGDLVRGMAFGKSGLGDSQPAGLWNDKLGLGYDDLEQEVRKLILEVRGTNV